MTQRKQGRKSTGATQVDQVVGQANVRPKMLSLAARQGQADENPHAGEAFPRFVFVDAASGVVTLQVVEAFTCSAVSARRLSHAQFGALMLAAMHYARGLALDVALVLACDGDDALLSDLRAYMREAHDAVLVIGERLRAVRTGAAA